GSSRTGRLGLSSSQRNGDGETARAGAIEGAAIAGTALPQFKILGDGQTPAETEEQLYTYLGQMMSRQPAVFPPLGELHARLPELERPSNGVAPAGANQEAPGFHRFPADGTAPGSPEWLEQKLNELEQHLSAKDGDRSRVAGIHTKLAEIGARIDALSAQLPGASAIEAIETKLDGLSRSFDETRDQSSADADRISIAAREILAAAARIQETREAFEATARDTAGALGQAVVATASRAAVLAAGQVATALQPAPERSGEDRLEAELRALNRQARESGERTE